MIFTRIQRGAERTNILLKNKFESFAQNPAKNTAVFVRRTALNLLVARIVTLPIPIHASTGPADLVNTDDAEPPVVSPLKKAGSASLIVTLSQSPEIQGAGVLVAQENTLGSIEVGQSYYDQQAAEREAEAAKLAAEKAVADEAARLQQIENEKAAQVARLAAERAAVQSMDSDEVKRIAYDMVVSVFGESQWQSFNILMNRESGWNPQARNGSSGACGIPQALPCSKLPNGINSSVQEQVEWAIGYIQNRYGTPAEALSFHSAHNWY